ncbi:MAG: amino acid permease [Actinobacteria bacterium]|nr:amino acid permease [Actinomycetota bacterium]
MTSRANQGTLGTFTGVFTPSILTILGIILFLRLGFVVGSGGLRNALAMIGLATAVSLLTSISLSAVATNIEVRGGGDYYLISRTLGVEFGGAIGIVLYLAQSVSVAFYAVGFGEAVAGMAGWTWSLAPQAIAAVAVLGLFFFAWAGADVASRFQYVVMALLVAALTSFYLGAIGGYDAGLARSAMGPAPDALGFWAVFAIFFPAVTGFTQGVSMSGDLRQPGKSLPRGTFAAVGLSTVVYVSVAVLMAGNASQADLVGDGRVMRSIAGWGLLIDIGVVAATLSSAMASFLGAPRILQSLAADRVFPVLRPFAAGHGPANNPRRGVVLSLGIALATVALGNLNVIAPVVSMFFLISYGLLNYATYYEARSQSPSFRPRFRFFSRRASLAGSIACLGAMLAINPAAGAGAVAVMYLIYRYLERRDDDERWIDASRGHYFQRAKESIRAMTGEVDHPRNWRPQILAFSADPERRARLLRFASWLEGNSGLTAVAQIIAGEGALKRRERQRLHQELERQVEELGVDAHVLSVLAPDPLEALPVVVQSFGIGPMAANTVVFGLPSTGDEARNASYVMALRSVSRLGVNVAAVSSDEARWEAMAAASGRKPLIDVWWTDDHTGNLSLLMAYLATRTERWARARIRLVVATPEGADPAAEAPALREMLEEARIPATVVAAAGSGTEGLVAASSGAALVMVPMVLKGTSLLEAHGRTDLFAVADRLPLVAAVMAGQELDLTAGPESGPLAEAAAAEERLAAARDRLRSLERSAAQAARDRDRLVEAAVDDPSLQGEVEVAEARVAEAADRVLRGRGRVEAARAAYEAARAAHQD